jgi:hypothetical protein
MHQKSENFENLLQETQEELAQANFQLHRNHCYFQQYQAQARQAFTLLQTSQAQLHRTLALLQTSQAQLHQAQKEREQYQSQLHLMQWELERSQFQLAIVSQTGEPSQVQYKLLVWDAWYAYRKGDLARMSQCLHQAMKCTPFSKTKTVSHWLNSFAELSLNKGESIDIQCLSNTSEWKQVIDRIVGSPKMTVN